MAKLKTLIAINCLLEKKDYFSTPCYLLGALGDAINALLCGAGRNIRLILKKLREKLFLFFTGLLLAAWHRSDCRKSAAALPAPVF